TAYQVRVKSLCGSGVESGYTTPVSFTTAAPPCVAPTNLAISNISSTGATATWTAGGSETSWQIEYKTAAATSWTTQTVTNPTYTMTGLQPSTNYQVRVKSLCGSGVESGYTTPVSFTTAAPPCVAPTNLAISNVSSTGATATWTAGGSETSWEIEYKTTAATTWTTQVVSAPTYTMTGLQPSTAYEVKVKSLCGTGVESDYTTVVSFTTAAPPCVVPTNLAISNISSTEATATWIAGGTESFWQIEYKTETATDWTTQFAITPSYTIIGLQPSTVYEVRVKSLCDNDEESGYTTPVSFTTSAPPCVAPTNLAISNVSSTGATATWTAGGSETSWEIEYKTTAATTWTTQVVSAPTYTMTGLQPSTAYEVKVKSLCGTGVESDYTTVVSFTTAAPPCVAPTNLTISNISITGATATWTAGGSETSWQIEYKTTTATNWTTQTVTAPTYTITGLQPSTNYQVRVKSLCSSGVESGYTTVVSFTTLTPCITPTNLAISNITTTEATATWIAGGSETSWQIEYKTTAATTWTTQVVTAPTYTITGLQPSTNYQVRVKSLCSSGVESGYTTVVSFTTLTPCITPTNLAISNISSTEATAIWTAGGSETSWQIEYKTAVATTWTTQVVSAPTYTMTGLQPYTSYDVRVKSLCGTTAESGYTAVVSFTTLAPPCVAPTNLAISNISTTEATATWTAGGSETSWEIEYKTTAATTWTTQVVTAPTYTITGLQPSTNYQVRVKSLCGSGVESDYTEPVTFTTDAIPTYTITATAGSNGTITPSGTVTVNEGASQTFIFTPDEGYQISTVIVDNQPIEPIPTSYTFENVQANHTIHVDFTVGIDENELSRYVTLYPNPTQSYIDLKLDKDYLIATECRIYDMYGKLMRILPIEEEITTIDVSDFAVGVYFVRLTTEQGQISKRFVKQ
ncbi:MAG TPA: fibronectin type III domain-containing protein, partial [Bacteroidales bacterium]|nr:fibronectin type III domain-containing protein [Bacteroidales bacterium]